MKSYNYEMVLIFMILCAIGAFYVMTIREGHDWGDDFSMYIHHAKNIAEGTEYNETGYIYNRYVPEIGPRAYPPVFPLMLAPVYKIFGLNLRAMKIELIITFLLVLYMIWYKFRGSLDLKYMTAIILIIGLNPFFWNFKDNVLSDIPFMVFLYLGLILIDKRYKKVTFYGGDLAYVLLISFTIYLAYETRTIGGILLGCILVYEIIVYKRPGMFLLFTTVCFLLMVLIQRTLIYNDSLYLDHLDLFGGKRLNYILENAIGYFKELGSFWENGFSSGTRKVVFILMSLVAFVGYIRKIYLKVDIYEIFFASYLGAIIIFPGYQGIRYLIPIIPLYVYYSLKGIKWLDERTNCKNCVFIILVIVIGASYVGKYMNEDFGPIKYGINKEESVELFKYIRGNTDDNDVIIFRKPRALALYTGRKVSVYPMEKDDTTLWTYFSEIGAKYFIIGPYYLNEGPYRQQSGYYTDFIKRNNDKFEEIYENEDFKVYRRK